jgi:hypothetical protein
VKEIQTRVEFVTDGVKKGTLHGWHAGHMLCYGGALYFMATKYRDEEHPAGAEGLDRTLIFKKDLTADTPWEKTADIALRAYTSCVDGRGRYWAFSPRGFSFSIVWRSRDNMDFDTLDRIYDGRNFYGGMGVDNDGNFLLMETEDTNHTPRFPNAMLTLFNDADTDTWHKGRMELPEGRFGYVAVVVRGRSATAVMQSTQFDPEVSRTEFGYNWRLVRLARCEDLMKGEWAQRRFLMPKYGDTHLKDMIEAPDGGICLGYQHRGGDTFEEASAKPKLNYITRIMPDLSTDVFRPGLSAPVQRLYVDSRGGWYALGRAEEQERVRLMRLNPDAGFESTAEWELAGTERLDMLYTLRPERHGGDGTGDTVHLMTGPRSTDRNADPGGRLEVGHCRFDLPVASHADR